MIKITTKAIVISLSSVARGIRTIPRMMRLRLPTSLIAVNKVNFKTTRMKLSNMRKENMNLQQEWRFDDI